jgi:hypothetical protein
MKALSSIKLVSLLALAAALSACAGLSQPYAQLYGSRYFRAPIDTYPVQIVSIDGRDTVFSPVLIEPGVRQITVQGPPDGLHRGYGEQRSTTLELAPCTRYYLVAQKANRLSSNFDIKIDYQEPIGGCSLVASK